MGSNTQLDMVLNVFAIIIFVSMFVLLFIFFIFYKKNDNKLRSAYAALIDAGFMEEITNGLYADSGLSGFVNRAYLLSRIVSGKSVKIERNKYLDPRAQDFLLTRFDFKWLKSFLILYYSSLVLVVIMMLVVFIDKALLS
ncbi:hypothetical protein R0595_003522 [Pluralibacter gergoviae]|nr:hypothetical protein [Pluralibacter gergoviae]ELW9442881.1 hypothetical protein [Pluralibacter gergoviae]